jgi:hypothetical protein
MFFQHLYVFFKVIHQLFQVGKSIFLLRKSLWLPLDQSNYHHLILQKPVGRISIPIQRYLATNAEQAKVESVPRKI